MPSLVEIHRDDRPVTQQANFKGKSWDEHEATLDKANLTELIIRPNQFEFPGNKLVIKGYPKLHTLYGAGLNLKNALLENLPSLRRLYLTK